MNTSTAVLIAAAMLSGAIYFGLTSGYRYQIVSAGSSGLAIFKVDKFTGETWMCGGGRCAQWSN